MCEDGGLTNEMKHFPKRKTRELFSLINVVHIFFFSFLATTATTFTAPPHPPLSARSTSCAARRPQLSNETRKGKCRASSLLLAAVAMLRLQSTRSRATSFMSPASLDLIELNASDGCNEEGQGGCSCLNEKEGSGAGMLGSWKCPSKCEFKSKHVSNSTSELAHAPMRVDLERSILGG